MSKSSGIFGNLFSSGIIETGAAMMGFNMPTWASGAIDIAGKTFGTGGDSGGGGMQQKRLREAKSYGGDISMGQQKLIGPGEQKASAAVEYQDELRDILAAVNLYAKGE